jgi:endonuclease III related protein
MSAKKNDMIFNIYKKILSLYGLQGWWPLVSLHGKGGVNPTKSGSVNGYHPGDYTYPKNKNQQWEILMGTLLTQNTNWVAVEKSLLNLKSKNLFTSPQILNANIDRIKECIKPSGYFNQKSERLILLAEWFMQLPKNHIPSRKEVLSLKGIGPETADSILLYAFKKPEFVVDAYTKRIFLNLGLIKKDDSYDEIKSFFETALQNIPDKWIVFQEYHALIVEHSKRYYGRGKDYSLCPLYAYFNKEIKQ